jgi:hypothetical protein
VARRVHEVEHVGLAVLGRIFEAHGLRLDGDAALALDIHRIEHLLGHFPLSQRARRLDQPVGQGRLAVVDMRHDGKVADIVDRMRGHVLWRRARPFWRERLRREIAAPTRFAKGGAGGGSSAHRWG